MLLHRSPPCGTLQDVPFADMGQVPAADFQAEERTAQNMRSKTSKTRRGRMTWIAFLACVELRKRKLCMNLNMTRKTSRCACPVQHGSHT